MAEHPTDRRMSQAASNNALWCDAVCRTHGTPGEFLEGIWVTRYKTPQFYPNAVTLTGVEGTAAQLTAIRDLMNAHVPGEWAVKDSFCALDLAPLGFRLLFEAKWIWRPAAGARPAGDITGVRWVKVTCPAELVAWEDTWSGEQAGEESRPPARTFLPELLMDDDIALIAAYQEQQIVAGVIANRTREVVGMSNVFVPEADAQLFRAGCLAAVMDAFPEMPIVGYEAGDELEATLALGFEALGALRIWVRPHGPTAQAEELFP